MAVLMTNLRKKKGAGGDRVGRFGLRSGGVGRWPRLVGVFGRTSALRRRWWRSGVWRFLGGRGGRIGLHLHLFTGSGRIEKGYRGNGCGAGDCRSDGPWRRVQGLGRGPGTGIATTQCEHGLRAMPALRQTCPGLGGHRRGWLDGGGRRRGAGRDGQACPQRAPAAQCLGRRVLHGATLTRRLGLCATTATAFCRGRVSMARAAGRCRYTFQA